MKLASMLSKILIIAAGYSSFACSNAGEPDSEPQTNQGNATAKRSSGDASGKRVVSGGQPEEAKAAKCKETALVADDDANDGHQDLALTTESSSSCLAQPQK